MQFEVTLDPKALAEAEKMTRHWYYWPRAIVQGGYFFLFLAVMVYGTFFNLIDSHGSLRKAGICAAVSALLIAICVWQYRKGTIKTRTYLEGINPLRFDTQTDGVSVTERAGSSLFIPWREFSSFREGKRVFLLNRAKAGGLRIVPKEGLSAHEIDQLRSRICRADSNYPEIAASRLPNGLRRRIPLPGKLLLMPVRIRHRQRAHLIQLRHLGIRQLPVSRRQIIPQLLLIARPDNYRIHARLPRHPVQCHLRNRNPAFLAIRIQSIHNPEQPLFIDRPRRIQTIQPRFRGLRLPPPELARQKPELQRTPHHNPHSLIPPTRTRSCSASRASSE